MMGTITHLHNKVLMFLCFIYTFKETNPQKGAYHPTYQFQIIAYTFGEYKSIIRGCSRSYSLSNSHILKKMYLLDLYNDLFYMAHLKSLFGPLNLSDIINHHTFYAVCR